MKKNLSTTINQWPNKMNKIILLFCFIAVYGCYTARAIQVVDQKPNIILIMADDLGYETLGVNGSNSYKTPHLDQLANEGMRFEHCYSTPLCTPSRVQLMTGKYNFRNYIGFGLLNPTEKTFGHYMKEAGYKTFIAGKWQLLGNDHQQKLAGGKIGSYPADAGFDDYCLWQMDSLGSRYKDPLLSIKGAKTKQYTGQFGPDMFVSHIEEFMETNKKTPFFVYYPMVIPHDPFVPSPDNPEFKNFEAKSKVNDPKYFGEMISYMDKLVGRLVDKTEELGIRENTLILFVGDNGTDRDVTSIINGNALKGNKGFTTNAGTHVPFIANWKGRIKKNQINCNLIDFTDFLPSIMEAATYKNATSVTWDGISFYPQLFGDESTTRAWVFCHYEPNWGKFTPKRYVHNTRWKLYGNGDFYNLERDPLEKNPLKITDQSKRTKDVVQQFKEVLDTYKK